MLWFKSKEEKEKEREQARLRKEQEEKIKREYYEKANIEANKIVNFFKKNIKEHFDYYKKIGFEDKWFLFSYNTSEYKDITLKIYIILLVAEKLKFHQRCDDYDFREVKYLFDGEAKKSKYYHRAESIGKAGDFFDEEDNYYIDENFKPPLYCCDILEFELFYEGYHLTIYKNKIFYGFTGDQSFLKDNGPKWSNSYDRGGLLMNR